MNTEKYIKTLKDELIPYMESNNKIKFLQEDNAPCHKSSASRRLKDQKGITILEWIPYSPDLNPIENLFAIFKKKVALKLPSNKEELINAIKYVWRHEIDQKYIESLIKSMPNRIASIIKSKEDHSKY